MTTDEYQNLVKGYLTGELALEPVATQLAQFEVEEGWCLYYNRDRGTAEGRALFEALEQRLNELVAAWREAHGDGPPRGTA